MKGRVFAGILSALAAVCVFAGVAQAATPTQTTVVIVGTQPATTNANGNPEWCEAIRFGSQTLANLGGGFNTPVAGGATVTFTVRSQPSNNVVWTGTGTTNSAPNPVNGRATATVPACTLDVGNYTVTASYPAASGNDPSTSAALPFRVTRANTDLVANSHFESEGSAKSQFLVLTARLTRSDNGAPISGQRIVFRDNDGRICSGITNANGVARCRVLETDNDLLIGRFVAQFRQTPHYRGSSDVSRARNPFDGRFVKR